MLPSLSLSSTTGGGGGGSSSSSTVVETSATTTDDSDINTQILQDALYLNSTKAASVLVSKVNELRERENERDNDNNNNNDEVEEFLNHLLSSGPDKKLPMWTRIRSFARYSNRARLASLRRTLDKTMLSGDNVDTEKDNVQSRLQRRRRALLVLLRTLSTDNTATDTTTNTEDVDDDEETNNDNDNRRRRRIPAILDIERKVISSSKESSTTTNELKSRIPPGLETPKYEILSTVVTSSLSGEGRRRNGKRDNKNKVEIRRYEPYSVCSVSMTKKSKKLSSSSINKTDQKLRVPELSGASSFGALAGYLFGKNEQSIVMKMTTPVQTSMTAATVAESTSTTDTDIEEDGNDRQMEFILPSDYWGKERIQLAPTPLPDSGVSLQVRSTEILAVLLFGGYASKKEAEKRKIQLLSILNKKESQWQPTGSSNNKNNNTTNDDKDPAVSLAQYNDPFTVPWKRRNEVSVPVVERKKK